MHTLGFLKGFDDADHLWSVLTRRQIAKSLTEFFSRRSPGSKRIALKSRKIQQIMFHSCLFP